MHQGDFLIPEVYELALRVRTNQGQSLLELSKERPVLLVFLRYLGCPFCRETLADLARDRLSLEVGDCQIILVHMEDEHRAERLFARYGLDDLPRVADAKRSIYRAFGLKKGSVWNLIGPLTWWRGVTAIVLEGHGLGWATANLFQMPGAFLVNRGRVLSSFAHRRSSDRPNYLHLASAAALN